MVSFTVILYSTKCFLFVYIYTDLSKLKAYKLFENSSLFKEANLCSSFLVEIKRMLLKLIEVQNAHLTKADMYP